MAENTNSPKNYTKKDLKNGKYEFEVTISSDMFKSSYAALLENAAKTADVPGFRKGMVPKNVVEEKMKDALLIDTFERLAPTMTWMVLGSEKLEPIVPVKYTVLPKLDLENDLKYTLEVVTIPTFTICDIRKIKVAKPEYDVKDSELNETLNTMFKNQVEGVTEKEMNDKWAAQVAAKYAMKGVKDLENLKKETKTLLEKQKTQIVDIEFNREIVREGVKLSKLVIPEEAVEYEAHERAHAFEHQLEDSKISREDYLKQYNVTSEQLEEAWKKDALEALEEHFFLNAYATERKIQITQENFNAFIQTLRPSEEMLKNTQWVDSLKSLYFKNQAFAELVKEVKANLGIEDKQKNTLEFAS